MQMVLEGRDQALRKHRHPVFFSLAIADEDLMLGKVHVFDAQAHTLHTCTRAARKRGASVSRKPLP